MTEPTLEDFIWALEQHVYDPTTDTGDIERPLGSNNVPGVTDFCGCNATWCAWCNMLLSAVYTKLGGNHNCWSVPLEKLNAENMVDGWVWVEPADIQRGDWVVFDWNGDGSPDHIGGCLSPLAMARLHTVEGNVNDRCLDQIRTMFGVMGAVRPVYAHTPAPQPDPTPAPVPQPATEDEMVQDVLAMYAFVHQNPDHKGVSFWLGVYKTSGAQSCWDQFMAAVASTGQPVP